MNIQGSAPFNAQVFARLREQVDALDRCDQLARLSGEIQAAADGVVAGINEQLAVIEPIMALMTAPGANPAQIVTWLTDFISAVLTPVVKPYATLPLQLAQVTAELAQLTAALQSASSRIGCGTGSFATPTPPPSLPTDL